MTDYNDIVLGAYFREMEHLTATISDKLIECGVHIDGFFVEYWPIFLNNQLTYKVWTGGEHIQSIDSDSIDPIRLSAKEVMEFVKRRKILMRKFI